MRMITGRGPVNFAGGRRIQPEMDWASKLCHRTNSASTVLSVSIPAVSLRVQRSTLPVVTSSEYTSEGFRTDSYAIPRSRLFLCQDRLLNEPAGNFGTACSLPL